MATVIDQRGSFTVTPIGLTVSEEQIAPRPSHWCVLPRPGSAWSAEGDVRHEGALLRQFKCSAEIEVNVRATRADVLDRGEHRARLRASAGRTKPAKTQMRPA